MVFLRLPRLTRRCHQQRFRLRPIILLRRWSRRSTRLSWHSFSREWTATRGAAWNRRRRSPRRGQEWRRWYWRRGQKRRSLRRRRYRRRRRKAMMLRKQMLRKRARRRKRMRSRGRIPGKRRRRRRGAVVPVPGRGGHGGEGLRALTTARLDVSS